VIEDITCDSDYMLRVMPLVGIAIREKMPWVPQDETIYLVMDNAGGHGTEEAIGEYTRWMWREFNIENISIIAITGSQCTRLWTLDVNPELGREAAVSQDNNS
jgi:hypothetical protein